MLGDEEIKSILQPHFGYLSLFKNLSKGAPEGRLVEIKNFINDNGHLFKYLPNNINSYTNYNRLIIDLSVSKDKHEVLKFIKDNFPSNQKNLMGDNYLTHIKEILNISKSDFKSKVLLRSISRYETVDKIKNWIELCYNISEDTFETIDKFLSDYKGLSKVIGGKTLINLTTENFKDAEPILPLNWCIKNYNTLVDYLKRQDIILCIDPYESEILSIIGINVDRKSKLITSINNKMNCGVGVTDYYRNIINNFFSEKKPVINVPDIEKKIINAIPTFEYKNDDIVPVIPMDVKKKNSIEDKIYRIFRTFF